MIRQATRYDIPRLLEFVEAYAYANPIHHLANPDNHNPRYVEQLLTEIIAGRGFALIDKEMRGTLIAIRNRNIWCPGIMELHELLWWVDPEHRGGTVGGRLWNEFNRIATEMLEEKKINLVVTSISPMGPMIDYTKRGYKPFSASFAKE